MGLSKDIAIVSIRAFQGGGGGSSGIKDVNIVDGHLMVTMPNGQQVDKGVISGDMNRDVYDTNFSGIVDNSEKVNGYTVSADVPADVNDKVKAVVNNETLSLIK